MPALLTWWECEGWRIRSMYSVCHYGTSSFLFSYVNGVCAVARSRDGKMHLRAPSPQNVRPFPSLSYDFFKSRASNFTGLSSAQTCRTFALIMRCFEVLSKRVTDSETLVAFLLMAMEMIDLFADCVAICYDPALACLFPT